MVQEEDGKDGATAQQLLDLYVKLRRELGRELTREDIKGHPLLPSVTQVKRVFGGRVSEFISRGEERYASQYQTAAASPEQRETHTARDSLTQSPIMAALAQTVQAEVPLEGPTQDSAAGMARTAEPESPAEQSQDVRTEVTAPWVVMRRPGESDEEFQARRAAAAKVPGSRVIEPPQAALAAYAEQPVDDAQAERKATLRGLPSLGLSAAPAQESPTPERLATALPDEVVRALAAATEAEARAVEDSIDAIIADESERAKEREAAEAAQPARPRIKTLDGLARPTISEAPPATPAQAAEEPDKTFLEPRHLKEIAKKMSEPPQKSAGAYSHGPAAPEWVYEPTGGTKDVGGATKPTPTPKAALPEAPEPYVQTREAAAEKRGAEAVQFTPPPQPHTTAEAEAALKAAQSPTPYSIFDEEEFPEDVSHEDATRPVTPAPPAPTTPAPAAHPKAAEPTKQGGMAAQLLSTAAEQRPRAGYAITPSKTAAVAAAAAKADYQPAAQAPKKTEQEIPPPESSGVKGGERSTRPSDIFRKELEEQKRAAEDYVPGQKRKGRAYGIAAGLFLTIGALAAGAYLYITGRGANIAEDARQDAARVATVERDAGTTTIDTLVSKLAADAAAPIKEEGDVAATPVAVPVPEPPVPPVPIPPTPIPTSDYPEQPEQPPEVVLVSVQPPVTPTPVMSFEEPTPEQPPVAVTPMPPTLPEQPEPVTQPTPPSKEGCKLRVNMHFDSTEYTDFNAASDIAKYVREMVEAGKTRFYVAGFASIETKTERVNDDAPYNVRLAMRRAEQVRRDILKAARRLGKNIEVIPTTYGETVAFGQGVNPENRAAVLATEPIADPEQSAQAAAEIQGPAGQEYGCDDAAQPEMTASADNLPKVMISPDLQTDDIPVVLASNCTEQDHLPKVMISQDLQTEVEQYYAQLREARDADELEIPVVVEQNYSREEFQRLMLVKLYKEYAYGKTLDEEELLSRAVLCGMQDVTLEKIQDIYLEMAAERDDAELDGAEEIIVDVEEPFELPVTVEQPRQRYFAGIDQTDVNDALTQVLEMESMPRSCDTHQKANKAYPEELTRMVYEMTEQGAEPTDIKRIAALQGYDLTLREIDNLYGLGKIDALAEPTASPLQEALAEIERAEAQPRQGGSYSLPPVLEEEVIEEEIVVDVEPARAVEPAVIVSRHIDLSEPREQAGPAYQE